MSAPRRDYFLGTANSPVTYCARPIAERPVAGRIFHVADEDVLAGDAHLGELSRDGSKQRLLGLLGAAAPA